MTPGAGLLLIGSFCGCLDFDQFAGGEPDLATDGGAPADLASVADQGPAVDGARPMVDLSGVCPVASRSCYGGPQGTAGVGLCRAGNSYCEDGVFGPCIGEVMPSAESCDGLDDDCDGVVDDNLGSASCGVGACRVEVNACTSGQPTTCVPGKPTNEICGNNIDDDCNGLTDDGCGCAWVSPFGNDMTGTGSAQAPFRTIKQGIALAGSNGLPPVVCVASGASCPSSFEYDEDVAMRDGVQVLGGYALGQQGVVARNPASCVTRIADQSHTGVLFDGSVMKPTTLDGFTVLGAALSASSAITIVGSTGAVVQNCRVVGGGTTMSSIGVNVVDGNGKAATPILRWNGIVGGVAPIAIAVASV